MKDKEMEEDFRVAAKQFPELASMFDELHDVMDELERSDEEDARREQAREDAGKEADEERAEKARSGELGPEWQKIQKRIDDGKTTLIDVRIPPPRPRSCATGPTRIWDASTTSGPRKPKKMTRRTPSPGFALPDRPRPTTSCPCWRKRGANILTGSEPTKNCLARCRPRGSARSAGRPHNRAGRENDHGGPES